MNYFWSYSSVCTEFELFLAVQAATSHNINSVCVCITGKRTTADIVGAPVIKQGDDKDKVRLTNITTASKFIIIDTSMYLLNYTDRLLLG